MASKHPWLTKRGNTFYLRAKVPADIAGVFPAAEVKLSLKTGDMREAARRINIEAAKVAHLFEGYRTHGGCPQPPKVTSIVRAAKVWKPRYSGEGQPPTDLQSSETLTNDDVNQIAIMAFEERKTWINRPTFSMLPAERDEEAQLLEHDISYELAAPSRLEAQFLLETKGYYFASDGERASRLSELLIRGRIEAFRQRIARLRMNYPRVSFDPFFPLSDHAEVSIERASYQMGGATSKKQKTLQEVIAAYEGDHRRRGIVQKTRNEDKRVFALMFEVFGTGVPVDSIKKEECKRFAELITALPKNSQVTCKGMTLREAIAAAETRGLPLLSAKGANKYIHKLSAVMKYAVDEGYLVGTNPASKLSLPHGHSIDDREPFSNAQLNAIFSSEGWLASVSRRNQLGYGASFWVPLFALYMGLRQGEACQLEANDFIEDRGLLVVKVQGDDELAPRRVKSKAARRNVPCHPLLTDLGFSKLLAQARTSDDGRLFPEEERSADGYFSAYSKRFSRFLRGASAYTKKTTFHSFRHNFRDAMSNAKVAENIVCALGGWESGWSGTASQYGSRISIMELFEAVQKVQYSAFPLDLVRKRR